MNPETQPTPPIETEEAGFDSIHPATHETVLTEVDPINPDDVDALDFMRAKEMEEEYSKRYVYAGKTERATNRNPYEEKRKLIELLHNSINPNSSNPYTEGELQCIYLYHVIIGGSLSSSTRDGFPMDMQYDVDGGLIEKFILSLPEVPVTE